MEQDNQQSLQPDPDEAIEPAMYQSRRQAEAIPESDDPNETFLNNIISKPSFFD